ncbi:adenine nucleotide alpha hydrolases-like protein [Choiromyces venosus 120613-1]|uniref:Adenine nucleotide alpha hydrolases-like protein n=1 Tax=Choiromyces venosus 120613-1 TaxID=1336337 RepID=A0A3N4JLH6_9PEZI|nr:adenine nucleotide alpha hydrolases-like protein [Choiromyces venosus 120613-1]
MTSPSPATASLAEKEVRPTSIAWTDLPEPPASEGRRRQSSLTSSVGSIGLPSGSARGDRQRSLSSPPPPPTFLKRVSFDTFDNKDATDFSLTLKSKHKDYAYTRRSRTFLCGTDQNDYSEFALEWLIDELVDDGDEVVCLRVVDKDSKISSDAALQDRQYRHEASKLLNQIIEKNEDDKTISIILEFAVGKVHETIQRMIHIYEPVILIVGTRGRSLGGLQGLLPGSVSKYCLQHSPVPVIVVRPSSKRDKKKAKRKADPGRKVYQEILHNSNTNAAFMNHGNHSRKSVSGVTEAMSNTSISSLGEPLSQNSPPEGDVSPKTLVPAPAANGRGGGGGNSPASESPTPNSEYFGGAAGGGVKLEDAEENK